MMNITVIGTGYVGLVTAACLAEVGHQVVGLDTDQAKIDGILAGNLPIHEPGLDEIVERNLRAGRIAFTSDYTLAASQAEVVFLAVGTPPGEDGSADLSHVLGATAQLIEHLDHDCLLVTKSTVPVGTCLKIEQLVADTLEKLNKTHLMVSVASNPEFLREGAAVEDFLKPDRIVVGTAHSHDADTLRRLYAPFNRNRDRMICTDRPSAEMIKYAANAMLATRISFMNEMSMLCETVGADVESVRRGLGSDPRIGPHFLYAGVGYGGSCFPKDVKALVATGAEHGCDMELVRAVESVNQRQRQRFIEKIMTGIVGIDKPRVAIWGLAFKPDTDDMREAPSIEVINALLAQGVQVICHDPVAMDEAKRVWNDGEIAYAANPMDCLEGADVLVVLTEWLCFREPDWRRAADCMRGRLVFDGRNIYVPDELSRYGFSYAGIGRV